MARIETDATGELVTGCFYALETSFGPEGEPRVPDSIIGLGPYGDYRSDGSYAEEIAGTSKAVYACARHAYPSDVEPTSRTVSLFGQGRSPFIAFTATLVGEWLARRLQDSGFKGLRLLEVNVAEDFRDPPLQRVFMINYGGRYERLRVLPESGNRCSRCGYAPIVCPDCHAHDGYRCSNCGFSCLDVGEADNRDLTSDRIKLVQPPEKGPVIDVRRWKGEDFFNAWSSGVVTRRVVEFLLSIHAYPFVANPLRAFVGDGSPEQLTLLEAAKRLSLVDEDRSLIAAPEVTCEGKSGELRRFGSRSRRPRRGRH